MQYKTAFPSNEQEINQKTEKKNNERYSQLDMTSKVAPEVIDHKHGRGWLVNGNHDSMSMTRGIVCSDEKQSLPTLVVAVFISNLKALHNNLSWMSQLRWDKELRFMRGKCMLPLTWRVCNALGIVVRIYWGMLALARVLPIKQESSSCHLILKFERYSSRLGWIRSNNYGQDSTPIIQRWRILFIVEKWRWQGTSATEPWEVFAVPVVSFLVIVVWVIIP